MQNKPSVFYSTYKVKFLVGVARLERAASWSRTMHSTKLSHTPTYIIDAEQGILP